MYWKWSFEPVWLPFLPLASCFEAHVTKQQHYISALQQPLCESQDGKDFRTAHLETHVELHHSLLTVLYNNGNV